MPLVTNLSTGMVEELYGEPAFPPARSAAQQRADDAHRAARDARADALADMTPDQRTNMLMWLLVSEPGTFDRARFAAL